MNNPDKRNVLILLVAQFLTAFADNALLFTAIALVLKETALAPWYVSALQVSFLIAFIVLAPWVGRFADTRPKAHVLTLANVVKALGAGLFLINVEPIVAYAIVGVGAAFYSPAKYGILPEISDESHLVSVNGWVESGTILAITSGAFVGSLMADYSVVLALWVIVAMYVISGVAALFIKGNKAAHQSCGKTLFHFFPMMKKLLRSDRARYATLAVGLFWGAAAVLRVILIAWVPLVLLGTAPNLVASNDIAIYTLFIAFGIAVGAVLSPYLIPLHQLKRTRFAALMMGCSIVMLAFCSDILLAKIVLLLIGVCGGIFVVPINAALQHIGQRTVGSGGAVAIQHFFENIAMVVTVTLYGFAAGMDVQPSAAIVVVGLLVLIGTIWVSRRLPNDENSVDV